jgi:hypothetical protein
MPSSLHDLIVEEVSLVDRPSCATTDPRTGKKIPRAVVAFHKRDGDVPTTSSRKRKEKSKMSKFKQITKVDSGASRDEIWAAVARKCIKIAKRRGLDDVPTALLEEVLGQAYAAFEAAPLPTVARKQALPLAQVTKAEIELDGRARRIMKSDNVGYPQACSRALTAAPSLYQKYCLELAAGETRTAPDPAKLDVPLDHFLKVAKAAEDDGVCHNCDEPVDDDDEYCSSCGSDLAAQHATKSKPKSKRKDDPGSQRV